MRFLYRPARFKSRPRAVLYYAVAVACIPVGLLVLPGELLKLLLTTAGDVMETWAGDEDPPA